MAGQPPSAQVAGARVTVYGSEGLGSSPSESASSAPVEAGGHDRDLGSDVPPSDADVVELPAVAQVTEPPGVSGARSGP
jgi:hypothetical protein